MEQMKHKRNNNQTGVNHSNHSIQPKVEPGTSIWNKFQPSRGELSQPFKLDERSFDCTSAPSLSTLNDHQNSGVRGWKTKRGHHFPQSNFNIVSEYVIATGSTFFEIFFVGSYNFFFVNFTFIISIWYHSSDL